ncbi:MAG: hypothetical protein ACRD2D_08875 [Terriglobales bacterium]
MLFDMMKFIIMTLEVLFYTGLAGCVVVVAISWVSVSKASFSRDN